MPTAGTAATSAGAVAAPTPRAVRVHDGQARTRRRAGAAPRGARLRARAAEAGADADVLPGRDGGERARRDPRARSRRSSARRSWHAHAMMCSSSTCTSREIDRPPSSRSDVFERLFVPDWILSAVSDRAWLQAMLDAERALAAAEAQAGVIPAEAADAIAVGVRRRSLRRRRARDRRVARPATRWSRSSARSPKPSATPAATSTGARRARTCSTPPRCSSRATPSR